MNNTINEVLSIINKIRPDINQIDENLFNININMQPLDMVYVLLMIKEKFDINLDCNFIDYISDTTIDNIAKAVAESLCKKRAS